MERYKLKKYMKSPLPANDLLNKLHLPSPLLRLMSQLFSSSYYSRCVDNDLIVITVEFGIVGNVASKENCSVATELGVQSIHRLLAGGFSNIDHRDNLKPFEWQ